MTLFLPDDRGTAETPARSPARGAGRGAGLVALAVAACLAGCDDGGDGDDPADFTLIEPAAGGATADASFTIVWSDNGAADATISIYFDTDAAGLDGTLVVAGITADQSPDSYAWDTSVLPAGVYWLYLVYDYGDGMPDRAYFPGSLTVSHPAGGPSFLLLEPDGAGDVADLAFEITWLDDATAGATLSLYFDGDDSGFDGTLIVGGIAADDAANRYVWDTSLLAEGDYWVYAVHDDGGAPEQVYAPGPLTVTRVAETTYHVATSAAGGDDAHDGSAATPWATIQHALDSVAAPCAIEVHAGTYAERLTVNVSGSLGLGYVTLRAASGEQVTLSGAGAGAGTEQNMIYLEAVSYVRIEGLEIRGAGTVSDASGVRIYGSGHHIEIRNCEIHEIRGSDAMGVTLYGADGPGIHDVVVDGCTVHDCDPAHSEALVVNGNVRDFQITTNTVRDVNNIGIDVIGGESWLSTAFPSNGLVAGNTVRRANSVYDGSAAGIYSDGASNLVVERNTVSECDFGIEIGAENPGVLTSAVTVRNNFVYRNYRGGIIFGGYDAARGRVDSCSFVNNTLYKNGRPGETTVHGYPGSYSGEVIVQWADDCVLKNNILFGIDDATDLVASWGASSGLIWGSNVYWRLGAGQAAHPGGAGSQYADPLLVSPEAGDLHIKSGSPAIDQGETLAAAGAVDIDGEPRDDGGGIDVGADER